jgi:hypothetical protein
VDFAVALRAKCDEIFVCVVAQQAARTNMVYLKAFRGSAILASPPVSLQHLVM